MGVVTHGYLVYVTESRLVEVKERPSRVWTMYRDPEDYEYEMPQCFIHKKNAFLEDETHDWCWKAGKLRYFSKVVSRTEPVWIYLEFEREE